MTLHYRLLTVLAAAALLATPAAAAPDGPTVSLSAHGSAMAENDMGRANAYFESTANEPAEVARTVNQAIADALAALKRFPNVKAKNSGTSTWPIYTSSRREISGWRMRSNLELSSTDLPQLSQAIGVLQSRLAVGQLQLLPSPDTLQAAHDEATRNALKAFDARARLISDALSRSYRLHTLNVDGQSGPAPVMRARAMAEMSASAAPIEAGDSTITVHVNGTIELTD